MRIFGLPFVAFFFVCTALNSGCGAGKDFDDWKTLRRLVLLAPTYRDHARKYAVISPEKIQASIPPVMVQMNFAMKAFPTMETAWEATRWQ